MSAKLPPPVPRPVPLRVLHIITGLTIGGAEMMLYKLLSGMDRSQFQAEVIALKGTGPMADRISALGVPLHILGARGISDLAAMRRLWVRVWESQPDVIQTWLYHADFAGGIVARACRIPVAWGIRQTDLDPRGSRTTTRWVARSCAILSRWIPKRIICCSEASRRTHAALGYREDKMVVIPNGFDLSTFRPNAVARRQVRATLGIPEAAILIGLVARFHAQKDHRNFVSAAAKIRARNGNVRFLLCGDSVTWKNLDLARWIGDIGAREVFHLLGRRDNVPEIDAALDFACSSSYFGEGFSNAIGEAMACGVPCVVTDVGDSALIVGDTGRVVPAHDSEALAAACLELIDAGADARQRLGAAARRRIEEHYGLPSIVARYERLYADIVSRAE